MTPDAQLERRIKEIDLRKHPQWYRPKLEAALRYLGVKWQLHPVHSVYRRVA